MNLKIRYKFWLYYWVKGCYSRKE